MNRFLPTVLVGLLAACPLSLKAAATQADLILSQDIAQPGGKMLAGVRLHMQPGWHTYWKNPGDSGLATRIDWELPEGFEAGPIQWPAPERIDVGPLTSYGYHGEVLLLTDIRVPQDSAGSIPIAARAFWLVCEEICIPGDAEFALTLPAGPAAPHPRWSGPIERTRAALPRAVDRCRR